MSVYAAAANVIGGILLLVEIWEKIPAIGRWIDRGVRALAKIEAVIGILAITAGILTFSWQGVLAIIVGLALGFSAFRYIPAFGSHIENLGKGLRSVKTILGLFAILVGLSGLL